VGRFRFPKRARKSHNQGNEDLHHPMEIPPIRYIPLCLIILLIGVWFRIHAIETRPMHGDEANQAVKAGLLYDTGKYTYDPHEHHGPTLYYATLPALWLGAAKDFKSSEVWQYRLIPALFGIGCILLILSLRRALGDEATLWAALFTAVSHAMVFYSKYYIQEILLVFFGLLALATGWHYTRRPRLALAIATGAALGLAHATKETCVILFAGMAAGIVATYLLAWLEGGTRPCLRPYRNPTHIAGFALAGLLVSVVLFSSFFTHWRGPIDSILTYTGYLTRAEGEGSTALHDKPWWYYLALVAHTHREVGPRWSEAFLLFAGALGAVMALGLRFPAKTTQPQRDTANGDPHFQRFLTIYTLFLLTVFSLIPYKTPWNILPFWQPLLMLGGIGVATTLRRLPFAPLRHASCLLAAIATAHVAWQTDRGNTTYAADPRNPYVYAHTSFALRDQAIERIEEIAAMHPAGKALHLNIVAPGGDYWPLPWYLRNYPNVGYWVTLPESPDADILIVANAAAEAVHRNLKEKYQVQMASLRPGELLSIFVRQDIWDALMARRMEAHPAVN